MSIRIVTDSAADMEVWELKTYKIELLPLTVNIDGHVYRADENFNKADFFRLLELSEVFPKTSQPAPSEFEDLFEDARQKGDELIFLSISSMLSGTHQCAAVSKGLGEYENVYVVDSKTACCCQKLLAIEAAKLRDQGKSAPQIVSALERLRSRVKVLAGLDTLEYLRRGGRLGRTAASLGSLARIKPVITVSKEGAVEIAAKCIGKGRAMKEIAEMVAANPPDAAYPIYGLYGGTYENLEELVQKLSATGVSISPKNQFCIGPVIGAHIGPGAYGIAYVEA